MLLIGSSHNFLNKNNCSNNDEIGIQLAGANSNNISYNTFTQNSYGISIELSNTNIISSNSVSFNGIGILCKRNSTDNIYQRNNIDNNNIEAINSTENDGQILDARNNWYGHPTGPYHSANNSNGLGNAVTDNILFEPWLGMPDGYDPIVPIISINPRLALIGETVTFNCMVDGIVKKYVWSDGISELYNGTEAEFSNNSMQVGTYTITLRVQDDLDIWSEITTADLVIHEQPTAEIVSLLPNASVEGDAVQFTGAGIDDGTITVYLWTSSLDGEIHNGTESSFSLSNLSNGTHTIRLKVLDNHDVWSNEISSILTVNGRPRALISTIQPNPAIKGEEIVFSGSGTDDVSIVKHVWMDGDQIIFEGLASTFTLSNLTAGTHQITFKVQDEQGAWSEEISVELAIMEDSDGDGVSNEDDAFPNDSAASKDSDGDGYPDEWNNGKSEADSTSGLKLDKYPDDPKKWKKEEAGGFIPGFDLWAIFGGISISFSLFNRRRMK